MRRGPTPIRTLARHEGGLILAGDEAWTERDWAAYEARRARQDAYEARPEVKAHRAAFRARPEVKAHRRAYQAAYQAELMRLAKLAREAGL